MIDKNVLKEMIKEFYDHAKKELQFENDVKVVLKEDSKNAKNPLGMTAYYDIDNKKIILYVTDRHIKDILRSLAHEIIHHSQLENGAEVTNVGEGYAESDENMWKMEGDAYLRGNLMFRKWEDMKKGQK